MSPSKKSNGYSSKKKKESSENAAKVSTTESKSSIRWHTQILLLVR